jgi:hypothetical protein
LRQYRNTPHPSTGQSPASMIFTKEPRTMLPEMSTYAMRHPEATLRHKATKDKMIQDDAHHSRQQNFTVGTTVLVKNR